MPIVTKVFIVILGLFFLTKAKIHVNKIFVKYIYLIINYLFHNKTDIIEIYN